MMSRLHFVLVALLNVLVLEKFHQVPAVEIVAIVLLFRNLSLQQ